jgi:hypothetical protein
MNVEIGNEAARAVLFLGIFVFEFTGQCIYNFNGLRGNEQPTVLYTSCADHSNTNNFVTCYSAVQHKLLMIFRIKYWSDNSSEQLCLKNNHLSQMLLKFFCRFVVLFSQLFISFPSKTVVCIVVCCFFISEFHFMQRLQKSTDFIKLHEQ